MKIKLREPIKKDNKEIAELDLNFEILKGKDLIDAEKTARMLGDNSPNALFSSTGMAVVAAKASGMIPEDIIDLSAQDYLHVTSVVSNFLYGWVLPEEMRLENLGNLS